VVHDPTQLNRQGPDEGPQYRSSIFYSNEERNKIAEAYVAQLEAKVFRHGIVTKVVPLEAFYPAEACHQNYAALDPDQPYILFNDAPTVEHFEASVSRAVYGKVRAVALPMWGRLL
jgi:peptide-methionine (S)-S-oxide reductase